jgi:hypothetical protein
MNDHMTASSMPREASARLAVRVRIGLAVDIRAPGRHGNGDAFPAARDLEAEAGEDFGAFRCRDVEPGQPLDFREGEIDDLGFVRHIADDVGLGGSAAADLQHQFGGPLKAGDHVVRIDAALETVAGIGDDAEAAAGLGDVHRIPQRRFDQHIGGVFIAAGMLAAHDAADRFDAVVVGDDDIARRQLVFAGVQRQHGLPVAGATDD